MGSAAGAAVSEAKTGVYTGADAIHPVTGAPLPIWIADYVLMSYGHGAIMAVPAHDERDHAFASGLGLPIREVVSGASRPVSPTSPSTSSSPAPPTSSAAWCARTPTGRWCSTK